MARRQLNPTWRRFFIILRVINRHFDYYYTNTSKNKKRFLYNKILKCYAWYWVNGNGGN
jgi:hypothetical protein